MHARHTRRSGTKNVLVQVADDVHAAADARRRREGVTWSQVVTELLRRWAAPTQVGAETPEAEEARSLRQHWLETDEEYRRFGTEKIDPKKVKWHRGLKGLAKK